MKVQLMISTELHDACKAPPSSRAVDRKKVLLKIRIKFCDSCNVCMTSPVSLALFNCTERAPPKFAAFCVKSAVALLAPI